MFWSFKRHKNFRVKWKYSHLQLEFGFVRTCKFWFPGLPFFRNWAKTVWDLDREWNKLKTHQINSPPEKVKKNYKLSMTKTPRQENRSGTTKTFDQPQPQQEWFLSKSQASYSRHTITFCHNDLILLLFFSWFQIRSLMFLSWLTPTEPKNIHTIKMSEK
jgi:hypothetical protein